MRERLYPPLYYRCHVFCCVNERPEGHERGSCSRRARRDCATT